MKFFWPSSLELTGFDDDYTGISSKRVISSNTTHIYYGLKDVNTTNGLKALNVNDVAIHNSHPYYSTNYYFGIASAPPYGETVYKIENAGQRNSVVNVSRNQLTIYSPFEWTGWTLVFLEALQDLGDKIVLAKLLEVTFELICSLLSEIAVKQI